MKKATLLSAAVLAYCILQTAYSFSQGTAINTNGNTADSSAILDVSSSSQGILIPRLTEAQKNIIPNPATSLMIFQTDGAVPGYYYNAGTPGAKNWVYLGNDNLGNHTATDSLNMSMNKIVNLATCTYNYDAANKLYVDNMVGAGGGSNGGGGGETGCADCISELSSLVNNGAAMYWVVCADSCKNKVEGGKTDWRMPTINEILFYRTNFPEPAGGWATDYIWSSTYASSSIYYMYLYQETLGAWWRYSYANNYLCRCVR